MTRLTDDAADAALVQRVLLKQELPAIRAELDRLNPPGEPVSALVVLPPWADDPGYAVRIGDDQESVLCNAEQVLERLRALPDGAPLGTEDPDPGTVWHALNASETEPAPSTEDYDEPYHGHGDGW